MQGYISQSLAGLDFMGKYKLTPYLDSFQPLVIFGMYRPEDYDVYTNHKGPLTVVWQGMDAKQVDAEKINLRVAKHYSISHWIKESLHSFNIRNEYAPIHATVSDGLKNWKRGNYIYFYTSDESPESKEYYGENMIEEIKERTGLKVIRSTWNRFNKFELIENYKKCFINLRLTTFDGCPNTNLEMGMMGRRSVFNGNLPHSLKWSNVDDICNHVMIEYENRHVDNSDISKDLINFVNQTPIL